MDRGDVLADIRARLRAMDTRTLTTSELACLAALLRVSDNHPSVDRYRQMRGYWDDWWQRSRATKEATVKGYVEVVF